MIEEREVLIMKTALTIAGSDSCGGAGIQADIKTMTMHGVYAMSAVTALTAQNTTGVSGIMEVDPAFLEKQLESIFTDIFPDAVKIGMVSGVELIQVIAMILKKYHATSGSKLLSDHAVETLEKELLPMAYLVTPNIPEAEILAGMPIRTQEDMEKAAEYIGTKFGCNVLLKGGHQLNEANDLLWKDGKISCFYGERINNPNTHGTGCTLSSAIASNLAKGYSLEISIEKAKNYILLALAAMLDLGQGNGPMNHAFSITDQK